MCKVLFLGSGFIYMEIYSIFSINKLFIPIYRNSKIKPIGNDYKACK